MERTHTNNNDILTRLFFKLLPVQVLIVAMGAVNSIVDGAVAGRCIDSGTVGVVGLYFSMVGLFDATGNVLLGGCSVLCGHSMGSGDMKKTDGIFSLDVLLTLALGVFYTLAGFLIPGTIADMLGANEELKAALITYVIGYSIGIVPKLLAQQIAFFLQMERQSTRGYIGVAGMIISNIVLNLVFVIVFKLGVFGLAIATSLSNWIYLLILLPYYLAGRSQIRFKKNAIEWKTTWDIIKIGFPGALLVICLSIRGMVLNRILLKYAGSPGLEAQSALNMLNGLFVAFALGVGSTLRMLGSVFFGEEDREALKRLMKIAAIKTLPLSLLVTAVVCLVSTPVTLVFFPDRNSEVFSLSRELFVIYALCIPLIVLCQVFTNYLQAGRHTVYVNIVSVFDGFFSMLIPSAILAPVLGARGVWLANPIGIILTLLLTVGYVIFCLKRFPKGLDEWMLLKPDFGVPEKDRLDLLINDMRDVTKTAETVQEFCKGHEILGKKAYYAALCLEEMSGNVVRHGFSADDKDHTVETKVILKDDDIMLRIKDDCIPFDPKERAELITDDDPVKNIGLRMTMAISDEMTYQNLMGLNVLTLKIANKGA